MFTFFIVLLYNNYGDNMNKDSIIVDVKSMLDLKKINNNTKYINICIDNPDSNIIAFLIENGNNYSYSDLIDNKRGYIYTTYDTFVKAEDIINNIIANMPSSLSLLEKAKYLYIKLGKLLGYDINCLPEKNDSFNFAMINTINNVWGSIASSKATNISFCKSYLYLCSKVGISSSIIMTSENGHLCNKLSIDDKEIIVDLTRDIPYIQAGFRTKYFDHFNNDLSLDKKISYVNEYSEDKIDNVLSDIDYNSEDVVLNILNKTEDIIKVSDIKPIELGVIYNDIFNKYCMGYDIYINNLYLNDIYNNKDHFILISYNSKHYSYNYKKNSFIEVKDRDLINNIDNNRIGIYLNEDIPMTNKIEIL